MAALLAALVFAAGASLFSFASAGAATLAGASNSGDEQTKPKGVATLVIIDDGVSVRRKGKDAFKPATDGQALRVGDTVKTDETGFAQINYTNEEDTFTRLDVNTEFTVVRISDEQGNRKVEGTLDTGRVWNRTTALTESESFSTEGAGATAAVGGSAYVAICLTANNCLYIAIVDGLTVTTVDGDVQLLNPLEQCDATEKSEEDSDLCAVPEAVALEVLLADEFIAKNFFLDALGGFPLPVLGIVTVENGQVTGFTPITTTPNASTPPASTAPVVEDPALDITENNSGYQGTGPSDHIETSDLYDVYFGLQGSDPNNVQFYWVFDTTPDVGTIYAPCDSSPDGDLCDLEGPSYVPVEIGVRYNSDTVFRFEPDLFTEGTDTFSFHAVNANGDISSPPTEATVTVHCVYSCGEEAVAAPNDEHQSAEPPPDKQASDKAPTQ